jgi:hypothetical protein
MLAGQGTHLLCRIGRALLQESGGGAEPTGIAAWNPRTHGYTVGISFGIVMPFAALISRGFRVRCGTGIPPPLGRQPAT